MSRAEDLADCFPNLQAGRLLFVSRMAGWRLSPGSAMGLKWPLTLEWGAILAVSCGFFSRRRMSRTCIGFPKTSLSLQILPAPPVGELVEEAAGRGAFQTRLWTVLAVSAWDKKYSPGDVLSDICFLFSPFSRCLSFREPSKENFNNVPDLELNPIRSKIVRAFFDNR